MSTEGKGVWAIIGQIAVILGIIWTAAQLYSRFISTDVAVTASGSCERFDVPQTYKGKLKAIRDVATFDDIKDALPKDLKDRDSIAIDIRRLLSEKTDPLDSAFSNFQEIRSFCNFTVSNAGNKEVQDIKLELPRKGVYALERLGEPDKEDKFDKVISIGKLNPGGETQIHTWNTDYETEVSQFEFHRFRVTHTNGITQVEFVPRNTTILGSIYESYPTITFVFFLLLGLGLFWFGTKVGASEEKKKRDTSEQKASETIGDSESNKDESPPPA